MPLELNITRTVSIMKHNYSQAAISNASSSVLLQGFFSWIFLGGNFQGVWEVFFMTAVIEDFAAEKNYKNMSWVSVKLRSCSR